MKSDEAKIIWGDFDTMPQKIWRGASRSYRWLGSIKISNKRIKEFPSSVNFKMIEVGKIQGTQAKPLIVKAFENLLFSNANFSH